jgi:hypothetical protein
MSHARTANLPGAIALGLADNILDTATRHFAHGGCTPAALSVIGHEPGQSIDFLARVHGMSHPGAVRLVNHLEADGPRASDETAFSLRARSARSLARKNARWNQKRFAARVRYLPSLRGSGLRSFPDD